MSHLRLSILLAAGSLLFLAGIVLLGSVTTAVATGSGASWAIAAVCALTLIGLVPGARRLAITAPRPSSGRVASPAGDARVWLDLASVVALVVLGFIQLQFIALIREGAQYTCLNSPPPLGANADTVQAEMTVLPPSLVCHYPTIADPASMLSVDRFSAGPWLFFLGITALNLTLLAGLLLRLGHWWKTAKTTKLSPPSATGTVEGPPGAPGSLPASRLAALLALGAVLLVVGWLGAWSVTATIRTPSWATGMISAALLMVSMRVIYSARHLASASTATAAAAPPAPVKRGWAWPPAILAALAVLVGSINQLMYGYRVQHGPDYACATRWPVPTSIISDSMVTADTTTFPPTLICHYAEEPGAAPTITVDQFPTGPEVFYISLGALTVAATLGLVLLIRYLPHRAAPAAMTEARRR